MKILKIYKNKIYLENDEIIDVNREIIDKYSLKIIDEIDDFTYSLLIYDSILSKALYILSIRDRTIKELKYLLKEKYLKKNYEIIENVIEYLKEKSFLNDYNYVYSYVNINYNYGRNKLIQKLMGKGIEFSIINDVLNSEYFSEFKDNQTELINKKIEKYSYLSTEKLIRKLVSQGFELDKILNQIKTKQ